MNDADIDIPYHVPLTFKVGQRVKVVKQVTVAHAWHNAWGKSADAYMGKVVVVREEDHLFGFRCEAKGLCYAWFPSCALEDAYKQDGPCVIEVPGWNG